MSTSQNGQDILVHLGDIKPILVDRYERWATQHPEEAAAVRAALDAGVQVESRPDRYPDHDESGWQAHEAARREAQFRRDEAKREEARRSGDALYKAVEQKTASRHRRPQIDTASSRKKEDALSVARRAANVSREPSLIRRDRSDIPGSEPVTPVSGEERERRRERDRERDDTRHYQEEAKRREEEEAVRRRSREQEGILRRQQEAEAASRAARRSIVPSPTYPPTPTPSNHTYQYIQPSPRNGESAYEDALPPSMPLESPTRLASSRLLTSYTLICNRYHSPSVKGYVGWPPQGLHITHPLFHSRPSYPMPITTTSPAPPVGHIRYPQLMSQHQLSQGYTPSLQSMFSYPTLKPSEVGPSSLLFVPDASKAGHLYPANALPRPPVPVPSPKTPGNQYTATYSTLSRAQGPPPVSAPPLHVESERFRTASQESARITRERASEERVPELKTVSLPRDCLPRFLSIAALNTSRNRETCGLLLGRDQKGKYVVTTLLIPKQHSTSDTCTMDEEELVMQFTEERALITLGWVSWGLIERDVRLNVLVRSTPTLRSHVSINGHPRLSTFYLAICVGFMSSVDLHTHSGFQRMLPESFAVVCAPKSTPKYVFYPAS